MVAGVCGSLQPSSQPTWLAVGAMTGREGPQRAAGIPRRVSISSLGDYHLEILARNDHRLVARPVAASDKIDDIARQPVAAGLVERLGRVTSQGRSSGWSSS
jgi:hypothetical protein